eukprot:tig00001095_g7019.t1
MALSTPLFLWLGMSKARPVAGVEFHCQPVVGLLSDRCTHRWGRRKPFIVGGCAGAAVAILLIAMAADVGWATVDSRHHRGGAVAIALLGLWLLDLSNNAVIICSRSLLTDVARAQWEAGAGSEALHAGNAIFSWLSSAGNLLGSWAATGRRGAGRRVPVETAACTDLCANARASFLLGLAALAGPLAVTALGVREAPPRPARPAPQPTSPPTHCLAGARPGEAAEAAGATEGGDAAEAAAAASAARGRSAPHVQEAGGALGALRSVLVAVFRMPDALRRVVAVQARPARRPRPGGPQRRGRQFASWVAWFAFILYATAWVGEDVAGGSPSGAPGEEAARHAFDDGVRSGALGLTLQSAVALLVSLFLPALVARLGPRAVWGASCLLLAALLLPAPAVRSVPVAVALIAATGVPWAVTLTVPFALVGALAAPRQRGLAMGVLNIFILLVALFAGPVLAALFGGRFAPALLLGALASLAAALLALRILPGPGAPAPPPPARPRSAPPLYTYDVHGAGLGPRAGTPAEEDAIAAELEAAEAAEAERPARPFASPFGSRPASQAPPAPRPGGPGRALPAGTPGLGGDITDAKPRFILEEE